MKTFNQILSSIKHQDELEIDIVNLISSQTNFPKKIVRRGVMEGLLMIDGRQVRAVIIRIPKNARIKYQSQEINIKASDDATMFDKFVRTTLSECFNHDDVASLYPDQKNLFFALLIEYFFKFKYNVSELAQSKYNDSVLSSLEEFARVSFTAHTELKSLKKKDLVDQLISIREESFRSFEQIVRSITNNLYERTEKLLNDFRHLLKKQGFKLLVRPILEKDVDLNLIVEEIIYSLTAIHEAKTQNDKIAKRSQALSIYSTIQKNYFAGGTDRISKGFQTIINHFKEQTNTAIGFKDTGKVHIKIKPEQRTYNFGRVPFYVDVIIENAGSGIAKNIVIRPAEGTNFEPQLLTDILSPKEIRKVKFKVDEIIQGQPVKVKLKLKWENEFKEEQEIQVDDFLIEKQDENLPWETLRRSNPYNSSQIVDDPEKLYGREKLLDDLRWNIEKNHFINSYILYGQKRVGKSSIVRTLETIYKNDPNIIFVYKTMADLKNLDAHRTFQRIGDIFSSKILNELNKRVQNEKEQLGLNLSKQSFSGSLSPLSDLIDQIHDKYDMMRFIIVIDEFDELNREFFENGELGSTLALSLGKGLNEKSYVGIILVGSENMISKTSQGMRLNTFEIKKIDTFDKVTEFGAYCQIIVAPAKSCLTFPAETLNLLFDYTNGNPYFTNFLASKIFSDAFERRISYIDHDYASAIIRNQLKLMSNKEFEHFWADSLSEKMINYETVLDRRKRLLMAFAETKNENRATSWIEIKKKIKYPPKMGLTETQMEDTLNEYKERRIFKEQDDRALRIVPELFEEWLITVGLYQVISQLEDKDAILDKVKQEQKLYVTDEELRELAVGLNELSSRRIGILRTFIDQFENNSNKRLIADLLGKMVVISSDQIIDHLKKIRRKIWGTIELGVNERDIRTDAELVCLDSSITQNTPHTDLIKATFKFAHNKTVKAPKDLETVGPETRHLIIYEPLIDCPFTYRNELSHLIKRINPALAKDLKIHIVSYIITDEARLAIEDLLKQHFLFEFEIHFVRSAQRSDISPFIKTDDTINDPMWKLLTDIDSEVTGDFCLVKIGQIVPYQCLPILWSTSHKKIKPLYPSVIHKSQYINRQKLSRTLQDLKFKSESNKLEFKASLSEPAYNWKAIKDLTADILKTNNDNAVSLKKNELAKLWSMKLTSSEKESMRKLIKHSIVKNLAAFANSKGGQIYVGIEDDFTIPGLIYDLQEYDTEENIRKVFDSMVNEYIGKEHASLFDVEFIELTANIPVLRISVQVYNRLPGIWVKIDKNGVKLKANEEQFFVRGQQEVNQLTGKEISNWTASMAR